MPFLQNNSHACSGKIKTDLIFDRCVHDRLCSEKVVLKSADTHTPPPMLRKYTFGCFLMLSVSCQNCHLNIKETHDRHDCFVVCSFELQEAHESKSSFCFNPWTLHPSCEALFQCIMTAVVKTWTSTRGFKMVVCRVSCFVCLFFHFVFEGIRS